MKLKTGYIAVVLLSAMFLLAVTSMAKKSVTNDEITHIASGYSYWKTGDFRLNQEQPPLVKLLSAFPLLFIDPSLPLQDKSWFDADQWDFAHKFFFESGNDEDQMLFVSRLPIVLLGLLLGYYIFRWAKELYGSRAALLALFLYALSPNILAHARLVTTDLAVACFIFISAYYLKKFFDDGSYRSASMFALSFGIALASKYTALYFIFIFGLLFIIRYRYAVFSQEVLRKIGLIAVIILLVLNISYFFAQPFCYSCKQDFSGRIFGDSITSKLISLSLSPLPVPAPYLLGLNKVMYHSLQGHSAFLLGERSFSGWWYYFIITFALKTPLSLIVMLLVSIYLAFRSPDLKKDIYVMLPALAYFLIFLTNNINIGNRHLLPIYPFIFVFVGKLSYLKQKYLKTGIILLLVWYAVSSILIYPHYLAYFNELAGGPDNGYNYLIDSNIDWGQDLKGLKAYMDNNNIKSVNLAYFGKDSPEYRGISYSDLGCFHEKGIAAISVNLFKGITADYAKCYNWLKLYKPFAKIGYSIFLYNVPDNPRIRKMQQEYFCESACTEHCLTVGRDYLGYDIDEAGCSCKCSE